MAVDRLLTLMRESGAEPKLDAVARWTEANPEAFDPAPAYGAFVDDEGRVVWGSQPYRAFLESDDLLALELAPETQRRLSDGVTLVFLDWGRQGVSWEEIFELWDVWESQDMIADCGAVGVPWSLSDRWVAPGWIAFRGDFDGTPLTVTVQRVEAPSFLARASRLRQTSVPANDEPEALPMLPFTLADLQNPSKVWPLGVV